MLEARNLSLGYGSNKIINDIEFIIKKGDITTIIGVNGSGKSTILKAISNSLKPQKGSISIQGKQLSKMNQKTIAKKISFLPQTPRIPDDFTVRDLVSYGRYSHLDFFGRLKNKDIEIIDWAINSTGIKHLQHRNVVTLSGGERQRTWIAMSLAQQSEILLLDEPTTFLDISHQFEVLDLIKDLNQALRYSKKIIAIKDGSIFKEGTPKQVIKEKTLREVFNINTKIYYDEESNTPSFLLVKNSKGKEII